MKGNDGFEEISLDKSKLSIHVMGCSNDYQNYVKLMRLGDCIERKKERENTGTVAGISIFPRRVYGRSAPQGSVDTGALNS